MGGTRLNDAEKFLEWLDVFNFFFSSRFDSYFYSISTMELSLL